MKIWLFRIVKAIVAFEIIYLLLLNIALNLLWTQSLINGIDSERYQVSWSRAWSFYPFDHLCENRSIRDLFQVPAVQRSWIEGGGAGEPTYSG